MENQPRPLLIALEVEDKDGKPFKVDTPLKYAQLMSMLGELGMHYAWEYPDHYPILPTFVVYEEDEGINYG